MKTPWQYAGATEHSHQVALFAWCAVARHYGAYVANNSVVYKAGISGKVTTEAAIPELAWLHAIHNQGHGDAIRGAKAAAEGVKPGVPDLFLPVPIWEVWDCAFDGYHGLYIELKLPKHKRTNDPLAGCSDNQKKWIEYLRGAGYCVEVCYGWEEARDAILRYIGR